MGGGWTSCYPACSAKHPRGWVCWARAAQVLAGRPELYATKPLKALRTALHALTHSKALEAGGKSLVGRVSDALRDERWNDALQALQVRAVRRRWSVAQGQAFG